MNRLNVHYEYWQAGPADLQELINKKLAAYGLEIRLVYKQERAEKTYIEKVSDNVERSYSNRIDGTIERGGASQIS